MAAIPLDPFAVDINGPVFQALLKWQFVPDEQFVSRILADDIPQRVKYERGQIWAYRDPGKSIVGFGALSICNEFHAFTEGARYHAYIPLLAVHPGKRGQGHGRAIVEHLVDRAANYVASLPKEKVSRAIFLDVYEDSKDAFGLYQKLGFQCLGNPMIDPVNGKAFLVMAKRIGPA